MPGMPSLTLHRKPVHKPPTAPVAGWYPIEFWGRPPCLGWQGIVPRRARIMAERRGLLRTR